MIPRIAGSGSSTPGVAGSTELLRLLAKVIVSCRWANGTIVNLGALSEMHARDQPVSASVLEGTCQPSG